MRKTLLVLFCTGFLLTIFSIRAEARPQYKAAIGELSAKTKAEIALKKQVKARSCKYCHGPKSKKVRTEYGTKLHDGLGAGDRKKYKYDKTFWKKGADGKFSPKAIQLLRDAIKFAAKK